MDVLEQFEHELKRANLNTHELDGVACSWCGKIPEIKKSINEKGKTIVDRSSRIDTDGGDRKEKLETYHIECYEKAKQELHKNQS